MDCVFLNKQQCPEKNLTDDVNMLLPMDEADVMVNNVLLIINNCYEKKKMEKVLANQDKIDEHCGSDEVISNAKSAKSSEEQICMGFSSTETNKFKGVTNRRLSHLESIKKNIKEVQRRYDLTAKKSKH